MHPFQKSICPQNVSTAIFGFGLLAVATSCLYGIGIVPAIVAITWSSKTKQVSYNGAGQQNMAQVGRVLAYTGLAMSAAFLIFSIVMWSLGYGPSRAPTGPLSGPG